ncbi:MAG TPA: O-antigen ligase family protein [Solirubrobacteraceae bacterium]|nr:O-antigen ligase family protein [Solirubrobacteraceae bacterium]
MIGEKLGVAVAVLLCATAVLARPPRISDRARAAAMLGALVLTPVLLVIDIWDTSQLRHLRNHPALAAAAIVAGLIALAVLALLFHRRPPAFPLLALLALPFRLPISTGGSTSNLLIPLYLVVGAGALAYLAPRLLAPGSAGADPSSASTPHPLSRHASLGEPAVEPLAAHALPGEPPPGRLEWLLMGAVVLYGLQAAYSSDFSKALENVVFFYVPFALLFMLLRRVRWTRELLLVCFGVALALAVLFAGIGFVEYHRRELLLNPKVIYANQYDNYFRVNSLFFDPSIYGRFLALVMLGVSTIVLWCTRRRDVLLGALVLLWLLAGLVTSFSQSSIAALLLGLAVLAAWRWDVRRTLYAAAALLAVAAVVVLAAPAGLHIGLKGHGGSASNATSGRSKLVSKGLQLFADKPLQGFGPGSFPREYRLHDHVSNASATSASHTTPITVAAEQGVVGLALYAALLLAAFITLFAGARRSPPRIALAACFAALILHTWTYADFLEDPLTWTLLGIGAALASADAHARRRAAPPLATSARAAVSAGV